MDITAKKINFFTFFKLPAAFWCGVRATNINDERCTVTVRHGWRNQNPFNSIYFAVQEMAAELSTGALAVYHIKKSNRNVSMLVTRNNGLYTKKATGKITFTCLDGKLMQEAVEKAISTGEGQTVIMKSIGTNSLGEHVSELEFEWSVKLKNNR